MRRIGVHKHSRPLLVGAVTRQIRAWSFYFYSSFYWLSESNTSFYPVYYCDRSCNDLDYGEGKNGVVGDCLLLGQRFDIPSFTLACNNANLEANGMQQRQSKQILTWGEKTCRRRLGGKPALLFLFLVIGEVPDRYLLIKCIKFIHTE